MRKLFYPFYFFLIVSLLTGCVFFRNPTKSFDKAVAKADKTQEQIEDNQTALNKQATKYNFAADDALKRDPQPNKYNTLAEDYLTKSLAVTGSPSIEDIQYLQSMNENLLSTNQALQLKGLKQEQKFNAQVASLQEDNAELKDKLQAAQDKIVKVGKENSVYATRWTTLMKIFWGIIYVVAGVFIIRIVTAVLPPPYNTIGAVIDVPIGIIVQLVHTIFPGVKTVAKVVPQEFKQTTEQLVTAIQKLKAAHPELHTEISKTVDSTVDSKLIQTINTVKTGLNIVS